MRKRGFRLGKHRDHVLDGAGADASVAGRTNRQRDVVGARAREDVTSVPDRSRSCRPRNSTRSSWCGRPRKFERHLYPFARFTNRGVKWQFSEQGAPCLVLRFRRRPRPGVMTEVQLCAGLIPDAFDDSERMQFGVNGSGSCSRRARDASTSSASASASSTSSTKPSVTLVNSAHASSNVWASSRPCSPTPHHFLLRHHQGTLNDRLGHPHQRTCLRPQQRPPPSGSCHDRPTMSLPRSEARQENARTPPNSRGRWVRSRQRTASAGRQMDGHWT